jgi:hypothetical protein
VRYHFPVFDEEEEKVDEVEEKVDEVEEKVDEVARGDTVMQEEVVEEEDSIAEQGTVKEEEVFEEKDDDAAVEVPTLLSRSTTPLFCRLQSPGPSLRCRRCRTSPGYDSVTSASPTRFHGIPSASRLASTLVGQHVWCMTRSFSIGDWRRTASLGSSIGSISWRFWVKIRSLSEGE